jgi:rhamnulose-1-phosphate aldolase/alcohol dehydrogenase
MASAVPVYTISPIGAPKSRWEPEIADSLAGLDQLVYRSNLLGADRAVANQGGGNTSMKGTAVDHTGSEVPVVWVKGSGSDLATITVSGFAELRLDDLLLLKARDEMTDDEMVAYIRHCMRPDDPRPSIETLLHAFVPAHHIDHTHPDAVIALTVTPGARQLAEATFGDEIVWIPWARPGFALAKGIADALDANPSARAVLLEKHGLITWGQTSEETYARTLEFVTRAADALEGASSDAPPLGGEKVVPVSDGDAEALLLEALPALRGALLAESEHVILEVDRSPDAIAFASSARGPEVSQIGSPCPDHLIQTKHKPLAVDFDPASQGADDLAERLAEGISSYASWYRDYYSRNMTDESREFPSDPAGPRIVLVPGVGIVAIGHDAARARFSRDLYHRAIAVETSADRAGGFASLSEAEAFQIEYWPLERYKLAQAPAPSELTGKIALVTGAGSGIGRATAYRLAALGAHVAVADINSDAARTVAEEIVSVHGLRRAMNIDVDVRDENAVTDMVRRPVLEWGGLDIVVCSAGVASAAPVTETSIDEWNRIHDILSRGYFLTAREAFRTLIKQGHGGSLIFVGSKNALVAGANASAYSSAKAASLHLARVLADEGGAHGIRVNTVNPDAVLEGSGIWSSDWKTARAIAYNVSEDDLPSYYRERSVLHVNVYPEDIAEAIAFLAGPRALKSTGNVLNVDAGISAAYPR